MRCLALAEALQERDCECVFICMELPGNLNAHIKQKGFTVFVLKPELDDVSQTLETLSHQAPNGGWSWLIIDHYGWDATQESQTKNRAQKIMVIDDLADRLHDCNLLLDQNYFCNPEARYQGKVLSDCKFLLGPRYALLRSEFYKVREQKTIRQSGIRKLLVSFGGGDPTNETIKVLEALKQIDLTHMSVDIILGASHPDVEPVQAKASHLPNVSCYRQVANMAERMAAADLFIGAGGTTTWERMTIGLPGIVIAVADNQIELSTVLADEGYQVFLGSSETVNVEAIQQTLSVLMRQPGLCRQMAEQGQKLTDGLGYQRVADILLDMPLTLRLAVMEDSLSLFQWRNHDEVRRFSHQSSPIPWASHQDWFELSLRNPDRYILIGEKNGVPVGVLRFDLQSNSGSARTDWIVSIYRVPNVSDKGLGSKLLDAGSYWLMKREPEAESIVAEILQENIASRKAFEKAGYVLHHSVYEKKLGRYVI